jgi:methanogenic corrinoid protein MtbC1
LVPGGAQGEGAGKDIAAEHLATFAVRAYLSNRYNEVSREASGPCVTLAVAPGEMHDLPLVHVANLVGQSGVARPLLLVGGLPISEVVESAVRSQSACIVLSATITPRPELVRQWIAELSSAGWESRTVLAGAGFNRSRVFSESKVRSAPGNYSQIINVLSRVIQGSGESFGRGLVGNGRSMAPRI